jgi:hypothetical protein
MICPFSVSLDNRARAAPIRCPGFENISPNLSGCTNCRPDLTHSVGPRWTGGRPDYWDPCSLPLMLLHRRCFPTVDASISHIVDASLPHIVDASLP